MRWLPIGTLAPRVPPFMPPFIPPLGMMARCAFVLASLWLTMGPAAAQMSREDIELRNQLYELQQQVQALQEQMSSQGGGGTYLGNGRGYPAPSGGGANGDMVAQLLARVQTLEEETRTLRGQVDQLQNTQQQQSADLAKRLDDLRFQMQNGSAGGGAPGEAPPPAAPDMYGGAPPGQPGSQGPGAPSQPGQVLSPPPGALGATRAPPAQAGASAAPPARRTPELAMQDGNLALSRRDYPAAEAAAREVLNNFRTSPRAYEAQFLLAQALAGERQFPQAAIAFDDTYNRNRKGSRAPEALVGLANALTTINEKRAACDTIAKLHAEFPQARPETRDAAASVQQRAGCH
jgi:TolA-binding protein